MRIRKSYLVIIVFALALFAGISIFNRKPDVDHDYDLEFEKLNNDVFDFTGTIWEGRQISLITVNDKNMDASYEALGIEPDKKLPKKSIYYRNYDFKDYKNIRDLLIRAYDAYRADFSEFRYTTAGYLAAQLAVWGRLDGANPRDVLKNKVIAGKEEMAEKILEFAEDLYYAPELSLEPEIEYVESESKKAIPIEGYNVSKQETVLKTDEGQIYWHTPLLVVKSGLNNMDEYVTDLNFKVTLSDLELPEQLEEDDILITTSAYNKASEFNPISKTGNCFYVLVPMFTDKGIVDKDGSFTVNIKADYKYLNATVWEANKSQYQNLISLDLHDGHSSFSFPVKFNAISGDGTGKSNN